MTDLLERSCLKRIYHGDLALFFECVPWQYCFFRSTRFTAGFFIGGMHGNGNRLNSDYPGPPLSCLAPEL